MIGNYDLTKGEPWKVIVRFALPLLGAFLLQQLYNTVDMLVMGNFVGMGEMSSVGASGNFLGVFITIATGLGSGITVCVANAYGSGRVSEVRRYVGSALVVQGVTGVAVTAAGLALARPVMVGFVELPESLVDDAVKYVVVYMAGFVFQMTYNAVAGVLRGLGDSRSSLWFLVVASVLNVVLDLVFVGWMDMGVVGVALATTVSQGVCAVVSWVYMARRYGEYMPWRGDRGERGGRGWDLVKTGFPLMVQALMLYVGFMLLQRTVNSFGEELTASYSVVVKVDRYIMGPLIVIFDAMAAFAGQNQGAGREDRIILGIKQMRIVALATAAVFCVVGLLVMPTVVGWFAMDETATGFAIRNLRMSSVDLFLYALYCPITGACLGMKQTVVPMTVSFLELTGRNVFARLLAPVCGESCIWFCEPPAWGVVILAVWVYFYAWVLPNLKKKIKKGEKI